MHTIILKPAGLTFETQDDETILDAALRQEIALPHGCREGLCGNCRVKVVDGHFTAGRYTPQAISLAERKRGYVLSCNVMPLSDMVIECPKLRVEKLFETKSMLGRVVRLQKLRASVVILHLSLIGIEKLRYLPGQYIDIVTDSGIQRSYSIAGPPHAGDLIELHVRQVPGGAFAEFAFNELKVDDVLRIEGPKGEFFLRQSNKPILFLASGTGFAPIKSILEDAFFRGFRRRTFLYWGARTLNDLYMRDLPMDWKRQYEQFNFVPVLSEPLLTDRWVGARGYVHEAVLRDCHDLRGYQVYACGSPHFVQGMFKALIAGGMCETQFFSDTFISPRNDAKAAFPGIAAIA